MSLKSQAKRTDTSSRGAVSAKSGLIDRYRAFTRHHRLTLRDSLQRALREPLQTLMTSTVIAIALSLPALLYLMVDNIRQLESNFQSFAQITVYVNKSASQRALSGLDDQLAEMSDIAEVTYISPQQALEEFKQASGFGQALQYLEENPLPPVFLVEPKLAQHSAVDKTSELVRELQKLPLVEDVQIDMLWLQRLRNLTDLGQKIALALAGILGVGVLLIIGNTIRLAIHSRRDEIVIIKLVGGTDAYVRRPFLYAGLLLGLFGALISSLILTAGILWLGQSIDSLSQLYSSQYALRGPGPSGVAGLFATGGLLGIGGAWLAVSGHLKGIKPR